jgi:hypothetical protein
MVDESELRDALDALTCAEAACSSTPCFVEGVRSECRYSMLPSLKELDCRRFLNVRGLHHSSGFRLLKAHITYSFEKKFPEMEIEPDLLQPQVVIVYAFWGSSEAFEEVVNASPSSSVPIASRSIVSGCAF